MRGERAISALRIGVLTPHASPGPEEEFPAMSSGYVRTRVVRVSRGDPTTPAALRALTAPAVLDDAAETLRTDPIDAAAYASTTSAYVIGFAAETAIASGLEARLAVPVVAACASAVLALRTLEVERVALVGAPWFAPEFNDLGAAYFRSQGFDVVCSRSAELAHDPAQVEPAAVCEWTTRHLSDEAQAVFIGGNGFRAAEAIRPLETAIGRPVLTANQVLLWHLLACTETHCDIDGYGQLLAHTAT